ncbi:MAG TPA: hypothetical protein VFS12_01455 [Terriglobia bacterium]|nr:hypothetical protein [Terriglobia bacterium]
MRVKSCIARTICLRLFDLLNLLDEGAILPDHGFWGALGKTLSRLGGLPATALRCERQKALAGSKSAVVTALALKRIPA